jgi:hypothetical protein
MLVPLSLKNLFMIILSAVRSEAFTEAEVNEISLGYQPFQLARGHLCPSCQGLISDGPDGGDRDGSQTSVIVTN